MTTLREDLEKLAKAVNKMVAVYDELDGTKNVILQTIDRISKMIEGTDEKEKES